MDEIAARVLRTIGSFDQLLQFEQNAARKGAIDAEMATAIRLVAGRVGRASLADKTGIRLDDLSPAEERIVRVVSEYMYVHKKDGRYPGYTIRQIKDVGLLGAAEASVAKRKPTRGYQVLEENDLEDLSYEQIVVDHPDEFSDRAGWFARDRLNLPNELDRPPAKDADWTKTATARLIGWLAERAKSGGGQIAPFANADSMAAVGINDKQNYGRPFGQVQSRTDFACYRLGLPPVGLLARPHFSNAWVREGRDWEFPVDEMRARAISRIWSSSDFDAMATLAGALPARATNIWQAEMSLNEDGIRSWAYGEISSEVVDTPSAGAGLLQKQSNPDWTWDEHVLAFALYIRTRAKPPGKGSTEVVALSTTLRSLASGVGMSGTDTFRNPEGVYMKLMNFRRFDPDFISVGKVGLGSGSKMEKAIWEKYAEDSFALFEAEAAIRARLVVDKPDASVIKLVPVASEPTANEMDALAALEAEYVHAAPERRRRISSQIERGPIGNVVKKLNGYKCQLCEALGRDPLGFRKKDGNPYVEAHHVQPVSLQRTGSLSAANIITVCANHHRHLHFGADVRVDIHEREIHIRIEGRDVVLKRLVLHGHVEFDREVVDSLRLISPTKETEQTVA